MAKLKTADELAAEEEAARIRSQAKALDDANDAKGELVALFEKQLDQKAKLENQLAALNEKLTSLAAKVDRPADAPALLEILNKSFDPAKAAARLADLWPKNDALRNAPSMVTARDYEVVPTGKKGSSRPKAVVRCCSDEGDAKAAYFRAVGNEWPVRVNLIGEYKPPVDTDSAAANAA
ncbi:MAG: hypothetical protein H0T51_15110 [Pirellulales bacterium]|nr:hypothetical protein [Pirellulales bacterium]